MLKMYWTSWINIIFNKILLIIRLFHLQQYNNLDKIYYYACNNFVLKIQKMQSKKEMKISMYIMYILMKIFKWIVYLIAHEDVPCSKSYIKLRNSDIACQTV